MAEEKQNQPMRPTETKAWAKLKKLHGEFNATCNGATHMRKLMQNADRVKNFTRSAQDLYYDFTRQPITPEIFDTLMELAEEAGLAGATKAMISGQKINYTEKRAVLHTALRAPKTAKVVLDGVDQIPLVHAVLDKVQKYSDGVRSGKVAGHTGKQFTHAVMVGIGGSSLGVKCVYDALATHVDSLATPGVELRFLANVDPTNFIQAVQGLNPETTLFMIASKTFTTEETMLNANLCKTWVVNHYKGDEKAVTSHFIALSTNMDQTKEFGIAPENVFKFWDWVGGRYSVWSAIGMVPLAVAYGYKTMNTFLEGARAMDEHFASTKARDNLPAIAALLSVYNNNFGDLGTHAVIPYAEGLASFALHLQQLEMESNGKSVAFDNKVVGDYHTGELLFGAPGTNSQHSFFQLLHQGTRKTQMDFIVFAKSQSINYNGEAFQTQLNQNQLSLITHCFSQADALACGREKSEIDTDGWSARDIELLPNREFEGNRPCTVLLAKNLDAYALGQLIAFYEHRTFVQGVIWGINSFDQFGVELGKVLAKKNIGALKNDSEATRKHMNPSTQAAVSQFHKLAGLQIE